MIPLPEEYLELPRVEVCSMRHQLRVRHEEGSAKVLVEVGNAQQHASGKHYCPYRFTVQDDGEELYAKFAWGQTGEHALHRAGQLAAAELEVYRGGMEGVVDNLPRELEPDPQLRRALASFMANPLDAFEDVRRLADRGIPWAEYTLATFFFYPEDRLDGIVYDQELQTYWMRRAASHYVGLAYRELSACHHNGWCGVPQDMTIAEEYRRRARLYGYLFSGPT